MKRLHVVIVVALLCGLTASPADAANKKKAKGTRVVLALPSPGDVTYGIVQVKLGKSGKALKSGGSKVFGDTLSKLKVVGRTPKWKALKKTTKVYALAAPAAGSKTNRNLVVFITRKKAAKTGPKKGKLTVGISNASAVKGSYWVRKVARNGTATVFNVRNIMSTAIGNWTKYLKVLGSARALRAAHEAVDTKARFSQAATSPGGTIDMGGSTMSPIAKSMYKLLFGTMGDAEAYQGAKRSPIVPAFISAELGDTALAAQWVAVAQKLPLKVPDTYAAAAKTEAQFTKITKPKISPRQVVIEDFHNSSRQAAEETPRLPGDEVPGQPVALTVGGNGAGTVVSDVAGISCPPTCSHFYASGSQVLLKPTAAANSFFEDWTACPVVERKGESRCGIGITTTTAAPTLNIGATFTLSKAGPSGSPTPTPPTGNPTAFDSAFGTGGFTATPLTQSSAQKSSYLWAMAPQADGKLVAVGTRDRGGAAEKDWVVARYTADGALDGTFRPAGNPAGVLSLVDSGQVNGGALGVAVKGDGTIAVVGETTQPSAGGTPLKLQLVGSNGDPGTLTNLEITGSSRTAGYDIAVQPNGKYIVVGSGYFGGNVQPIIARFNADGTADTAFNSGSAFIKLPTSACDLGGSPFCEALSVTLATSGTNVSAIYAGGFSFGTTPGARVFKFTPQSGQDNVALDISYPGSLAADKLAVARDILVNGNGEAVVAGEVSDNPNNQCGIARLQANGTLDPSFGSGGASRVNLTGGCELESVVQQAGGAFVVAGGTFDGAGVIGRFTANGQPDTGYVAGGLTRVAGGPAPSFYNDLVLQGTKPVVAGGGYGPPHQLEVARFNGAG